ncbi:Methyltransferase domain-containing protein [Methanobrevibacter olleyae]|uniref:Methyltransferase domain-containing protein n=2 Tax=Methanobrevibacter olleyae TaxID=294671 RepID=A0A126QZA9_METOL|nr:SAM-dependent methyltransferase [Methanobrevibacter olleyae]SFL51815.1 Methyltransferase domain-containing protein [Methanobrevibacter olleyae]
MKVYRQDLNEVLEKTDVVVELGSHVGRSSELILYKLSTGSLISIDNSPEAIKPMERLSRYNNNFRFISGDVRLHETLEEVVKSIDRCDVLSIDLGGGYHPDTVFKVYYIWSSTLKPRDVLIRNQGLIDFVNSVDYDEEFESSEGWLESCGNQGIPPRIKEFSLWTDKID